MGRASVIMIVLVLGALGVLSSQSHADVKSVNTNFIVEGWYVGNSWYVEFTKLSVTVNGQMTDGNEGPITVFPKGTPPQLNTLPLAVKTVNSIRIEGSITAYVGRVFGKTQKGTANIAYSIPLTNGIAYNQPVTLGAANGLASIDATTDTVKILFQFTDQELSKICTEDYNPERNINPERMVNITIRDISTLGLVLTRVQ
ncbi:MAG: hypothetical protein COZ46_06300 [Verrucomicrobia bacterium CG_4_10_14_3_um_filter_43_23]|nr:MAG: hypothetical protein AUJ82_08015 [Verrucomicrobia bacterium CG1_02_43_26]PIP59981.1 MAG: hypothetical protein COX01_01145 [Verrucomicrobia bacterium CG22_combo_CG10-13_8_21_14_all_43_17]PIX58006.1 MAG: hypothetical protein COZ46_06300 [Verrucomicrobia bacterium CG_4_10_14_3_um_filter_43_23]PIY61892.1 MAG: hypothetical protein COY94_03580 [Verrucomicrobia bacterium CG_4_10_14_0_8_um_filter_43_34]PJA43974.1 MAG: hypothetical protein CO175_05355 [Verrucomicrobia bacterium CG_4_9_14_3_um_fi